MARKKTNKYNKKVDWGPVEQDWAAGQQSRSAIARKHKLTRNAIDKHMRKAGIEYGSLASSIRLKVQAKLIEQPEEVADAVAGPLPEENVEKAAEKGASVIRFHRKDINKQFEMKARGERLLKKIHLPDEEGPDLGLEHIGAVKVYADTVNTITQTTERLIRMQREAYSLDEPGEGEEKSNLDNLPPALLEMFEEKND